MFIISELQCKIQQVLFVYHCNKIFNSRNNPVNILELQYKIQQQNCNIKSNKCHFSLTAKLQCSKNSQLKLLRQKRTVDSLIILHDLFVSYFDNCKDKRPVVTTVSWWNCQRRRTWHSQTFLPGIFTFLENIQGNSAAPALFGIALDPQCIYSLRKRDLVYFPGVLAGLPFGKLTGERIGFVSGVGLWWSNQNHLLFSE